MITKYYKNLFLSKHHHSDRGFSLIETVIALTTLGVCLAYAMPLFLYAKINNAKSEIRTGALIVSQRVFDDIRSKPFTNLPLTDGKARDPDAGNINPVLQPADINNPTAAERLLTKAMGRQYQTKVIYCEDLNTDPTVCSTKYRKFKVEVSYNGNKVYDLEGTYTEFE
jgi:prepilin-type N-terminal cleavage/methylation domain-containing protein